LIDEDVLSKSSIGLKEFEKYVFSPYKDELKLLCLSQEKMRDLKLNLYIISDTIATGLIINNPPWSNEE